MRTLLKQFKVQITEIAARLERLGFFKGSRDELTLLQQTFLTAVTRNELRDSDLPNALFYLTEVIHALNPKNRAIVLVDEYDTPTSHAVQQGYLRKVCALLQICILRFSLFLQASDLFRIVFSRLLKVGSKIHIKPTNLIEHRREMTTFEELSWSAFCRLRKPAGSQQSTISGSNDLLFH
jgi:hypothetical protein